MTERRLRPVTPDHVPVPPSGRRRLVSDDERDSFTNMLLARAYRESDPGRRWELVMVAADFNRPIARTIACAHSRSLDDLEALDSAAYTALVQAAHAFDPTTGGSFLDQAVPKLLRAVQRHVLDPARVVSPRRKPAPGSAPRILWSVPTVQVADTEAAALSRRVEVALARRQEGQ